MSKISERNIKPLQPHTGQNPDTSENASDQTQKTLINKCIVKYQQYIIIESNSG